MTLRDLRKKAGLSYAQTLVRFKEVAPEAAPDTRNGIVQIERRGTDSAVTIRALSVIYGASFDLTEEAAAATRSAARQAGILAAPRSKIKLPTTASSA
jgi:transcriptional regulator with XRE-family HTH domain